MESHGFHTSFHTLFHGHVPHGTRTGAPLPMDRASRRLVKGDRLAGHGGPRTCHWAPFDRADRRDSGERDVPAGAFWQALAPVARWRQERGIQRHRVDQPQE